MARLFVYGSLRAGAGHPMAALLSATATPEGAATVRGRLYAVSWYPGLLLAGTELVRGELWRLVDPSLLPRLDAYEGCGPAASEPAEFRRVVASARRADGTVVSAWVYVYAWPVRETDRVRSGDWLAPTSF